MEMYTVGSFVLILKQKKVRQIDAILRVENEIVYNIAGKIYKKDELKLLKLFV